jgi:DNA-binding GntR family transcriptional regulator
MSKAPATRRTIGRSLLREEIRAQLMDDILNGRLLPGTRVVETRIAQQFGVSQAPVREALRDLALFGMVVSSPFRGTVVRKISTEDLVEIYPIRAALEGLAARAAAARIDEAMLTVLEGFIDSMRDAARRGDQRAHVNADFAFHQTIVRASGNRMLEQMWETLRLATTTGVTHSMSQMTQRSLQEIGERHTPVLAALRARDPRKAEAAMRAHIEEPGQWIVAARAREAQKRTAQDTDATG